MCSVCASYLTIGDMLAESCDQFPLRTLGHVENGPGPAAIRQLQQGVTRHTLCR